MRVLQNEDATPSRPSWNDLVRRWDLPGGDGELLFAEIREKLYSLGDNVVVLPGHGPATTIDAERRSNPFVRPT